MRLIPNALAALPDDPYPAALDAVLSEDGFVAARHEIDQWPSYAATPLHDLAGLAKTLKIGALWYKDEAPRFGLGIFKALGGAYAVFRWLAERVKAETGPDVDSATLLGKSQRKVTERMPRVRGGRAGGTAVGRFGGGLRVGCRRRGDRGGREGGDGGA